MSTVADPDGGPVVRDAVLVTIPCRAEKECYGQIPVPVPIDTKEVVKCPTCLRLHAFARTERGMEYGTTM